MEYRKDSFLAGLAVGRRLKGWAGVSGLAGYTPAVSVEPGNYTGFYIDFVSALSVLSTGLFNNAVTITTQQGLVQAAGVEQISPSKYWISASIGSSGQVQVFGSRNNGLYFSSLAAVPGFVTYFWVDDKEIYSPGYIYDHATLPTAFTDISDSFLCSYPANRVYSMADSANILAAAFSAADSCEVIYT